MWLMLVTVLFLMVAGAVAQTNTPPPGTGTDLPQSVGSFWELAIAGVAPIIVWLVRKIVPKIPSVLLPSVTPFIGIGLGLLLNQFVGTNLSWFDMAKAGALAVFVRETINQAVTKRLADEAKPVTG